MALADQLEREAVNTNHDDMNEIINQISPTAEEKRAMTPVELTPEEKKNILTKSVDDKMKQYVRKYSCFVRALVARKRKETYNIPDLNKIVETHTLFSHVYDVANAITKTNKFTLYADNVKIRSLERAKLETCIVEGCLLLTQSNIVYANMTYMQREFVGLIWLTVSNFVNLHTI